MDDSEVEIRGLSRDDEPAVRALHEDLDKQDVYLRFFTALPVDLDLLAEALCREDDRHHALGAFRRGTLLGVANYVVAAPDAETGPVAECAVAVRHGDQHRGIGTALMRRLTEDARRRGVVRLLAYVLSENTTMLEVFEDLGWSQTSSPFDTNVTLECDLIGSR